MVVFLWAISLLFISVFIHLTIWKIQLPHKHRATLLKIFSLIYILWIIITIIQILVSTQPLYILSIAQIIHISLFYMTISLSYTAAYVAIESDSPSGLMINSIFTAGKIGLSRDELFKLANSISSESALLDLEPKNSAPTWLNCLKEESSLKNLNTGPEYLTFTESSSFNKPLLPKDLITEAVKSGLKLTDTPSGSSKVYSCEDISPLAFLINKSVLSTIGVSIEI